MYLHRQQTERLRKLIQFFPAVVITGARQVGKSTFIKHVLGAQAAYVEFDPVVDVENARQDPDLFLNNRAPPLILDEIQYAPEVVAAIKRRIDKDRSPGQYVLTGSQQWGVLRSMAESLAGRAVFLDMDSFSLAEIAQSPVPPWLLSWLDGPDRFLSQRPSRLPLKGTLYEHLWRGFLPEAQFLPLDLLPDFHQAYVRTYIERDVRLLADVSDWQLFGRFVRLLGALSAQEINYSQIGRELGITPQTARRWLDVLRATFQWFEVPAYEGNAIKRVSGRPKGYFADTGVACMAQAISSPNAIASHPLWGALFETAIACEVRKQCALMSPRPQLYHYRSRGGAEVDLLLERDGTFFPIEIKAKSHPGRGDTRGITAFREAHPHLKIEHGLVLAPCETMYPLSDRDHAVPWDLAGVVGCPPGIDLASSDP